MMSYIAEAISGAGTRPLIVNGGSCFPFDVQSQRDHGAVIGQHDSRENIGRRDGASIKLPVGIFTFNEDRPIKSKTGKEAWSSADRRKICRS